MKFKSPLIEATLLKRYPLRFMVEVALPNKRRRTVYCPNLGLLPGCDVLGSRIWISSANSGEHRDAILDVWELVEVDGGSLLAIHPDYPKYLIIEAVNQGLIPELKDSRFLDLSVAMLPPRSIEVLLSAKGEQAFLHIIPLLSGFKRKEAYFPEIPTYDLTAIQDIIALRQAGHRTLLFFCVQNTGIDCVKTIGPAAELLRKALSLGVEIIAYRSDINLVSINLQTKIPVLLSEDITFGKL